MSVASIPLAVRICAWTALAATSAGCTAFPGGARIYDYQTHPVASVPGLTTRKGDAYVLYVHGMNATPRDFFKPLLQNGKRLLKSDFDPPIDQTISNCGEDRGCRIVHLPEPIIVRGEGMDCETDPEACIVRDFGELRRFTLKQADRSVHVYVFYWDAAADRLEHFYSYKDKKVTDRPSALNRVLKDRIVNEGFSDAVLYAGRFGRVMRQGLESALCLMATDSLGLTPPAEGCRLGDLAKHSEDLSGLHVALVAKSLGSRYVFDTLLPIDQLDALASAARKDNDESIVLPGDASSALNTIKVKRALAGAVTDVFLLANQLPLLGLAQLEAADAKTQEIRDRIYCEYVLERSPKRCRAPWVSLARDEVTDKSASRAKLTPPSFFDFVVSVKTRRDSPTLVAFHDPEDLLGYKAGVHLSPQAADTVNTIEIHHRNAFVWLFSFAWPPDAHATEDQHEDSAAILWCGATVDSDGRVSARDCAASASPGGANPQLRLGNRDTRNHRWWP